METFVKKLFKEKHMSKFSVHVENEDYFGCEFKYKNKKICFRKCKETPKKQGFFVTLWKKIKDENSPYSENDNYDLFIFYVENNNKKGIFKFPKSTMIENKILETNNSKGKMGFRIYTPWDTKLNKNAEKTQSWQILFFTEL